MPSRLLGVLARNQKDTIEVKLLRTAEHPLAGTLLRNFLRKTLEAISKEGRRSLVISDVSMGLDVREAVAEFGFVRSGDAWLKYSLRAIGTFDFMRDLVRVGSHARCCRAFSRVSSADDRSCSDTKRYRGCGGDGISVLAA